MPKIHIYVTTGEGWKSPETTFDLSEMECRMITQNSIERVINTSRACLETSDHEDSSINMTDWDDLRNPVCRLFDSLRNSLFTFPWTVRRRT